MRVLLLNNNRITKLVLPEVVEGSFWLTDEEGKNVINIESAGNQWMMKSNEEIKVYSDNSFLSETFLSANKDYILEFNGKQHVVRVENTRDDTIMYYGVSDGQDITIGGDSSNTIFFDSSLIKSNVLTLNYSNNKWSLNAISFDEIYVNDYKLRNNMYSLSYGDTIFILGMRINVYKGAFSINNPSGLTHVSNSLNQANFLTYQASETVVLDSDSIKEVDLYKDEDYFFKTPRMRRFIEEYDLKITRPPGKFGGDEMPAILVLGPMLTTGLISVITCYSSVSSVVSGESSFIQSLPMLLTSFTMLISTLLWPTLTSKYQKKVEKRKEAERQKKYKKYLDKKREELYGVAVNQKSIICENLIPLKNCEQFILGKTRNLWERRVDQKDFLTIRAGNGTVPLKIKVDYKEEDFTMEEDNLKEMTNALLNEFKFLSGVPVSYSFYDKNVTAIMGNEQEYFTFVDNALLQLMSFHSYDDLKIVFLTGKKNLKIWEKYKDLPHCFSNDRQIRFFGTDEEEIKYISSYLENEYVNRVNAGEDRSIQNEDENKKHTYTPYYLIITDDYPSIRRLGLIENILKSKDNYGFSVVCTESRLGKLPSECENFIVVDVNSAILSTNIGNYYQQNFNKELDNTIDMEACCASLSNIPIEFVFDNRKLPTMLGFLEMFNVGKVEQLNSLNRWRLNDPIKTLRAQIGVNDEANPIYLDLHEKFHGPHGLIAGTTGSGKSEFIITYILSMALNYSPNEVSFILIDYKGGGLAGAFQNKTLGLKLPHLAGTITNLDKASLNRTLVSITSELERRQHKFNEVRDQLGESTIDIYKYQRFFREGKINEPMPHLFIISDEFAELKSQQPEFMEDLISTARIGRSLGIHLILATQKPSGVVNDQIWSNSKFKVCLKVQDQADSNEMLKKPDAANITNAGRFYLQVGNDEIFVLGQSGWAGTSYTPSDVVKKKYDRSISFIDDVGNVIKSVDGNNGKASSKTDGVGDELGNVLKYICSIADKEKLKSKNLWLEAIPKDIYIDNIIAKYNKKLVGIEAVLGEYDAPSKQIQNILTLRLDEGGNTLIYGNDGSNREMLLSALIYSLCITYTAEDVNLYIADFGSEALRVHENFPQVGDIVYVSERDKLIKMISIIDEEIRFRKKEFADYNGEFNNYLRNSGKKIPLKVFIINNFDSCKENFPDIEETLVSFSRDGERYGIVFIISATNMSSVYSILRRNFHQQLVLDMKDIGDYIDILGKIGNVYPAGFDGRGLFKDDIVYEFQTAQICDPDNLVQFVKNKIELVKEKSNVLAPNIPVLPEVVTIDILDKDIKDLKKLPIGINKDSLKTVYYDFFADKATIISSKDVVNCIDFLKGVIYGVRKLHHMTVLIDTEQMLSSIGGMVNTYADKNFEEFILMFEQFLDREIDGKNIKVLCIIAGLEKFQGSMNEDMVNGFFNGVQTLDNVNLIFVDSSFKLKKVGFEPWYDAVTNNSNGIWIGSGFMEQNVFNCSEFNADHREKINKQYAWIIKNNEADLVKIMGEKEKDEE